MVGQAAVAVGGNGVAEAEEVGADVGVLVGVRLGEGVGVLDGVGVGPGGVGVRLAVGEGIGISPVRISRCSSAISRMNGSGQSRANIHSQFRIA